MNYLLILILIILLIILTKILIKATKIFLKVLFIIIIVGLLILSYNYLKQKEKPLECSLSQCDCTCYPKGQTPEEKEGVLCGINCLGIYNVSSCTIINNECQAI